MKSTARWTRVLALASCAALSSGQTAAGEFRAAERGGIPNEYIVIFDAAEMPGARRAEKATALRNLGIKHGAEVLRTYDRALHGGVMRMSEAQARALAKRSDIALVEQNQRTYGNGVQTSAPWNLDRIDQRSRTLDGEYEYVHDGTGVHAYVIDTGIELTHNEFTGRISTSYSAIGGTADDCHGHGTHVAGILGGTNYGVAKNVTLHAVRVHDCNNSGTVNDIIEGIDWVLANHVAPAVANLSLSSASYSSALNSAVGNLVAAGIVAVVSAGNDDDNACDHTPSSLASAITVSSINSNDARAPDANFGSCVDIFAPGENVTSAWIAFDDDARPLSGTSMAAPHVAGTAALYLQENPNWTPAKIARLVAGRATIGSVTGENGAPDAIVFTRPVPTVPDLDVEYLACFSNTHRYRATWSATEGLAVSEFDLDYRRDTSTWYAFYNGLNTAKNYATGLGTDNSIRARSCNAEGCSDFVRSNFNAPNTCINQ